MPSNIPDTYDDLIKHAAEQHLPFDWRLYKAQLWQESKFNPKAKSPVGATGIAQFMPNTWAEWCQKADFGCVSAEDPEASIYTGAVYMRWLWDEWSAPRPEIDRWCLAAASYNSGLGDLLKAQKLAGGPSLYGDIIESLPKADPKGANETISYVKKILDFYNDLVTMG